MHILRNRGNAYVAILCSFSVIFTLAALPDGYTQELPPANIVCDMPPDNCELGPGSVPCVLLGKNTTASVTIRSTEGAEISSFIQNFKSDFGPFSVDPNAYLTPQSAPNVYTITTKDFADVFTEGGGLSIPWIWEARDPNFSRFPVGGCTLLVKLTTEDSTTPPPDDADDPGPPGDDESDELGTIRAQLLSAELLETPDDIEVQNATVHLFRQDAFVREQQADELIDDYIEVLADAGQTLVDTIQMILVDFGQVVFRNLPLVDDNDDPINYTLQIEHARSEALTSVDSVTRIVHFVDAAVPNLMAVAGDPVPTEEILLVSFEGFEVNSGGDAPDLDQEDDVCDTGQLQSEDRPECTLRAAIQQANAREGRDLISFNIPGEPLYIIAPNSGLPSIKDAVVIDGNTQPVPEDSATPPQLPKIQLDGRFAGHTANGYTVKAMNVTIRGQRIVNFEEKGILLDHKSGNAKITGNIIGVGSDGTAQGNDTGIRIDSTDNTIGGIAQVPGKAPGNVISGNFGDGISILVGMRNRFLGNLIGLDPSGTSAVANTRHGIFLTASSLDSNVSLNEIGGTTAGAGNVISGNEGNGITIQLPRAIENTVEGNVIGLDKTGTKAVGNGRSGVQIFGGSGNIVGGTEAGASNIISGNRKHGITVRSETATENVIQGNIIGFDSTGVTTQGTDGQPLGNESSGIEIQSGSGTIITSNQIGGNGLNGVVLTIRTGQEKGARKTLIQGNWIGETQAGVQFPNTKNGILIQGQAKKNTIGGSEPSDGNSITSGDQSAVVIESGKKNRILANTITMVSPEVGTIAIDLGSDGITLNDIDGANTDADKGPNGLQNSPAILDARVAGGDLQVTGRLFSKVGAYTIQVFRCDGNPGRSFSFIGSLAGVETDTDFTFTDSSTALRSGNFVAATATDEKGNTSEFSVPCEPVR